MEKIKQFKIEVVCDFKDPDDRKCLFRLTNNRSKIKTGELDDKIYLTYIGSISKTPSYNALDFIDEIHKYITNGSIANEIAYCVFGAVYSLDSGEETTRIQANFNRKYSVRMEIPNCASHVNVMLYRKDGEAFCTMANPRFGLGLNATNPRFNLGIIVMANPKFALGAIMKRLIAYGLVADYAVLKLSCEELLSRYEDGVSTRYVDEIDIMDAKTGEIYDCNIYFEIPR